MPVGPVTAAWGAATTGFSTGYGLFNYNRANWLFDAGMRFARYIQGYSFANEQVAMYREDIDDLTLISVGKMDNIHAATSLMMVIIIQLIMAGRLGVHGPAPPGWLMGLYWANCGIMFMWDILGAWLAMHAGARATAGQTFLKTRAVRMPIPTPKQLDKARVYGNNFEKQRAMDILRVPFVMPAPRDQEEHIEDDLLMDEETKSTGTGAAKARKDPNKESKRKTRGPLGDWRVPGWAREEVNDMYSGLGGPPVNPATTPEHFELYRGLQHEWWAHETYARVCIMLSFCHWLHAASMYIQSHCFIELRAMWPAFTCTACFIACHYGLLNLDIMSTNLPFDQTTPWDWPVEKVVIYTPALTVLGMFIDYSVIYPSVAWQAIIYVLSYICYIIHIMWTIRIWRLCMPAAKPEQRDNAPGSPWWPGDWQLPHGFAYTLYLVAPPKHLEEGESCLWQEMKAGSGKGAHKQPPMKAREVSVQTFPWKIMRGGLITMICVWLFMTVARIIETANGERQLLKQEGRVVRWPSHMQPWMTPWTRYGTRNEWCHTGGCDRRLGAMQMEKEVQMAEIAQRLLPTLTSVAEVLQESEIHGTAAVEFTKAAMPAERANIAWPTSLQPGLLACGRDAANTEMMVALERHQQAGAVASQIPMQLAGGAAREAQAFKFAGLDGHGKVMGAHWPAGPGELLLTLENGALAECPGLPQGGVWHCQLLPHQLPLGGSSLRQAVVGRIPGQRRYRAAVVYHSEPTMTLFEGEESTGEWLPTGEVHLPALLESAPSHALSMSPSASELILSAEGGTVLKWSVTESEPTVAALPPRGDAGEVAWQTACRMEGGRLARMALRRSEAKWTPEVVISMGM